MGRTSRRPASTGAAIRRLVERRVQLTVILLPAYAPELNPVEVVWAHLKRSLANLAKKTLNELRACAGWQG
ncbi:hypothetical protein GCM10018965_018830 [Nonomuraea roseola]